MPEHTEIDAPHHRLALDGELTVYRAAELKPLLIDAVRAHRAVAADLGAVTEFDSAGVQLLMLAGGEAQRLGHDFVIERCSEPVRELLAFFNLPAMLPPSGDTAAMETTHE
ncbi:STAS domain-containing protein [Nitrogeniibacter mangrovi]|uniref:STAS domain-containing protein n=1 Tax=Nitrogeniibacter mangrovi TaxID=2016596 RepID=A0A6C1B3N0_9RHOO|nr:STAS domain-containing protein [Nitrogeniibacter mangrovi]QID16804.1 STAS domain-containing protein [Nitrogeniibacter mangrovi]